MNTLSSEHTFIILQSKLSNIYEFAISATEGEGTLSDFIPEDLVLRTMAESQALTGGE